MMILITPQDSLLAFFRALPRAVPDESGLPDISVITREIRGRQASESRWRRWSIVRQTRPLTPNQEPAGEQGLF